MKAIWIGLATIAAATSPAVMFPHKQPAPSYWSGTNCRAIGSNATYDTRGSNPEVGISEYKIKVSGGAEDQQVFYQTAPPPRGLRAGSGSAVFDSSHFEEGTLVTVTSFAKAIHADGSIDTNWTDDGGYSAVVMNRALIATTSSTFFVLRLGGSIYPQIGNDVRGGQDSRLATMNYERKFLGHYDSDIVEWELSDFLADVTGKNVVTLNTHGKSDEAVCMDGTSPASSFLGSWTINPGDLFLNQLFEVGSDALPPFNASYTPPINLMYLGACNQGNFAGDWALGALWPYLFEGGVFLENQAVFGLKPYITGTGTSTISNHIFEYLKQGETLEEAIRLFWLNVTAVSVSDSVDNNTGQGLNPRQATVNDFVIFGDRQMRIHGVYTGTNTKASAWWRS